MSEITTAQLKQNNQHLDALIKKMKEIVANKNHEPTKKKLEKEMLPILLSIVERDAQHQSNRDLGQGAATPDVAPTSSSTPSSTPSSTSTSTTSAATSTSSSRRQRSSPTGGGVGGGGGNGSSGNNMDQQLKEKDEQIAAMTKELEDMRKMHMTSDSAAASRQRRTQISAQAPPPSTDSLLRTIAKMTEDRKAKEDAEKEKERKRLANASSNSTSSSSTSSTSISKPSTQSCSAIRNIFQQKMNEVTFTEQETPSKMPFVALSAIFPTLMQVIEQSFQGGKLTDICLALSHVNAVQELSWEFAALYIKEVTQTNKANADSKISLSGPGDVVLKQLNEINIENENETTNTTAAATNSGFTVDDAMQAVKKEANKGSLLEFALSKKSKKKELLRTGRVVPGLLAAVVAMVNVIHLLLLLVVPDVFDGPALKDLTQMASVAGISPDTLLTMDVLTLIETVMKQNLNNNTTNVRELMIFLEDACNNLNNSKVKGALCIIETFSLLDSNWTTNVGSFGLAEHSGEVKVGGLSDCAAPSTSGGTVLIKMLRLFFSQFQTRYLSNYFNDLRPGNTFPTDVLCLAPSQNWEKFKTKYIRKMDTPFTSKQNGKWCEYLDETAKTRKTRIEELKLLPTFLTSNNEEKFRIEKNAYEALVRIEAMVSVVLPEVVKEGVNGKVE